MLMNLLVGSEGTMGVITEVTFQIERLPETRLFRAVLFNNIHDALEAGREIMLARLQPAVLRLYDEGIDCGVGEARAGVGPAGRIPDPHLRRLCRDRRGARRDAMKICADHGARDLGPESAEHWWEHRYDFYYPPFSLSLPRMYGTIETVCTIRQYREALLRQERGHREGLRRVECALHRSLLALVPLGRDGIRPLHHRRAAHGRRMKRCNCTTVSGPRRPERPSPTAACSTSTMASASSWAA